MPGSNGDPFPRRAASPGVEAAGLPVREYTQGSVDFVGGEVGVAYEAIQRDWVTGIAEFKLDYVRATQRANDEPLPRIPPLRVGGGIVALTDPLDMRLDVLWYARQDRIATLETPTDGFVMLGFAFTWRPLPSREQLTVLFEGRNLLNADARNSVSFLEDFVPLPGRDFRVSLRAEF